ncbi:MAG: apolipoprotein N-acyltransferase [Ilumatobacteraceae bacterium]
MTDTPNVPTSLRARLARPALALGAGALVALSMPPWGFWPLAILGVVLFEVTLGTEPTRRERLKLGWLFGAGWMFLGMGWMIQLTPPGYIVAGAAYAGYHALAALVAPCGPWRVIGRPAAHALAEAVRFSFPFGGVPLATMGISQVAGPLIGPARIGGAILITWIVFQIGLALIALAPAIPAVARRSGTQPSGIRQATAGLVAVVLVLGLAAVAPRGSPTGEVLTIAAVQGGGEQGTTALEVPSSLVTERHLEATATIDPDPDLDLVLWPENTIDVFEFEGSSVAAAVAAEAARLGVPIAVGITEDVELDNRFLNAQVVVAPDGTIVDRYDKVRRVPFGEYVPLRGVLERITSEVNRVGEAVAGTGPAVVELPDGTPLAVVISWEVFFGGRAREGVREGGEAILNPTNGASYTGTIVQTQQVASSRLRAIENGRWVVQAAPTGFTALIDADGNVLERSAVSERRIITGDVELRTGFTWYTSLGDRPFFALLLLVLGLSIWFAWGGAWLRDRLRARRTADEPDEQPAEASVS